MPTLSIIIFGLNRDLMGNVTTCINIDNTDNCY